MISHREFNSRYETPRNIAQHIQVKEEHFASLDYSWSMLRKFIAEVDLKGWNIVYHERSVTIRTKTRIIKITVNSEVFYDRLLKDKSFRSEKFLLSSVEEAASKAKQLMF